MALSGPAPFDLDCRITLGVKVSVRILFAGGGSGGSAAPVIAVAEAARTHWPDASLLYVGTRAGPEAELVRDAGLPFVAVRAGRLRRYLTLRNLTDPSLVLAGLGQSLGVVRDFRPDVAFGAGGFATVPPLLAARMHRVPIVVHQQDVLPGLANRILAPFACRLTCACAATVPLFRRSQPIVVGNPVRQAVFAGQAERARTVFDLESNLPLVLAMGGGTGALRLNQLVAAAAPDLIASCQIVHLTGAGKVVSGTQSSRYHQLEFVSREMADLLAAAEVVVTRAGMSSLAEIAALSKAAIVVPMPNSHQEANAAVVEKLGGAIVVQERELAPERLAAIVLALLEDEDRRRAMRTSLATLFPSGAAEVIVGELGAAAGAAG